MYTLKRDTYKGNAVLTIEDSVGNMLLSQGERKWSAILAVLRQPGALDEIERFVVDVQNAKATQRYQPTGGPSQEQIAAAQAVLAAAATGKAPYEPVTRGKVRTRRRVRR